MRNTKENKMTDVLCELSVSVGQCHSLKAVTGKNKSHLE